MFSSRQPRKSMIRRKDGRIRGTGREVPVPDPDINTAEL